VKLNADINSTVAADHTEKRAMIVGKVKTKATELREQISRDVCGRWRA